MHDDVGNSLENDRIIIMAINPTMCSSTWAKGPFESFA
jgi:hypothetical protein